MDNIDFKELIFRKPLGSGLYGTTYLVDYKKKFYALKIQHILPKDRIKNYKNALWRELDLYDYIDKLKPKQQMFFTKLYGYEIINNCNHKQIRDHKIKDKKLLELDKSTWCIKMLTEYKSNETLGQYLIDNKISVNKTYSIILQICNMMMILYDGGYSHGDLHAQNIMLNKTKEKTFTFLNKKIPFNGLHLTAIDYGEVLHKKFGIKYKKHDELFLKNRKKYLFNEMYYTIINIITNFDKYINGCLKIKQKLPWDHKINTYDNGVKLIINNYHDFFTLTKNKYIKLFPKSEELIDYVEKNINKFTIEKMVKNKKNEPDFWHVIQKVVIEFQISYPKIHSEYFKWCSYHKCNLPKQDIIDIMLITDVDELINYLLKKYNYHK
jgi:hypothetical protein